MSRFQVDTTLASQLLDEAQGPLAGSPLRLWALQMALRMSPDAQQEVIWQRVQQQLQAMQQQGDPGQRAAALWVQPCLQMAAAYLKAFQVTDVVDAWMPGLDAPVPPGVPNQVRWQCLIWQAGANGDLRRMGASARVLTQAISLARTMGSDWRELLSINTLSKTYRQTEMYDQARRVSDQALAHYQRRPQVAGRVVLEMLNFRARAYGDQPGGATQEHLAIAVAAQEEAVALARRFNHPYALTWGMGNLASLRLQQHDPSEALRLAQEALAHAKSLGPLAATADYGAVIAVLESTMGRAWLLLGHFDVGMAAIARAQRLMSECCADSLELRLDMAGDLAQTLAQTEHWREAVRFQQQYIDLDDRSQRGRTNKAAMIQMAELQAQERTEQMQRLQLEQQAMEASTRQQQRNTQVYAVMGGVCLLLLPLLGLAAWRLRRLREALSAMNAELKDLSERDVLTGLPNRRGVLATEPGQRLQSAQALGLVALLDLDHFKRVNDSWGHAAGDEVLRTVAQRLRAALPPQAVLGRWGGEELLLLVPDVDAQQASALALEVLQACACRPVVWGEHALSQSLSMGYVVLSAPAPQQGLDELLAHCDKALYAAKANGRNQAQGQHWTAASPEGAPLWQVLPVQVGPVSLVSEGSQP
ncbi:GGDEF domain-containing protein [Roseateles sp. BYS180W]|uniref:diguanylate cyclase n=1 Tax=Roseateles rivi TaxID=3299028 RepID=A0ABW7FU21_9BURK